MNNPPKRSPTPPALRVNSLQNYQQHSRLHFIGQWKTRMKDYLRTCFEENPSWCHGPLSEQLSFIHMDLDAFFCSVQLAKPEYAHLRERPVGVAAGTGNSDISSCNYVARKYGVHAGLYVNAAKQLCPDLVTIGYDFEACERVVKTLYRIIFDNFPTAYKMAMEVYSVDDVMLATDTGNVEQLEAFCHHVREELKEATGCTVSCGIGPNVLLSRLVTSLAKPDGVFALKREEARHLISKTPFADIHGAGPGTVEKVKEILLERGMMGTERDMEPFRNKKGIRRSDLLCADVQKLSKADLQRCLGQKAGEKFFYLCRGEDNRVVIRTGDEEAEDQLRRRRVTSVGCSMNYAVRPASEEDVWKIIREVLNDVCQKLKRHRAATTGLRLTVLERHPLHPKTTQKFLGRGKCVEVHFSIKFPHPLYEASMDQMMAAIQETLKPLLVLSRLHQEAIGSDGCDTERAKALGVDGDLAQQTIWTVSLPTIPDLLIEDLRGFTVQAARLVYPDTQAPPPSREKRQREAPSSKGQLTLSDLFVRRHVPAPRLETVSSRTSGASIPESIASSKERASGPLEIHRSPGVGLAIQKQPNDAYASLTDLLRTPLDADGYLETWESACEQACVARDYFVIKACLRSVALQLIRSASSNPAFSAADTSTAISEQLHAFEEFVKKRLPVMVEYR